MLNLEHAMGIYMITNNITGDCYIGQSVDIPRRIREHLYVDKKPFTPVKEAIKQYGKENFSVSVLEECQDRSMLYERELYWIGKLQPAYNIRMGGVGDESYRQKEETKVKLRDAGKRQWKAMSDEQKAAQIARLTGPPVGHPVLPETREKLRQANLGKKASEESKAKRSATFAAKRAAGWHKAQPKEPYRRYPIVCNETGKHYNNVTEAASDMGMCRDTIFRQLNGKRATAKGYTFSREV